MQRDTRNKTRIKGWLGSQNNVYAGNNANIWNRYCNGIFAYK